MSIDSASDDSSSSTPSSSTPSSSSSSPTSPSSPPSGSQASSQAGTSPFTVSSDPVDPTRKIDPLPEAAVPFPFEGPRARLVFEDGTEFEGTAFGALRSATGEAVFATGMVGYPESLTDPSYAGQILTLTFPLVGNYGVRPLEWEHNLPLGFEDRRIHVRGLVVSTLSHDFSHWQSSRSLSNWLEEEGVVGIQGVDTRAITQKLRSRGCTPAKIVVESDASAVAFEEIAKRNLVAEVSCPEPILYEGGSTRVVLVDCGLKANIVRSLLRRGASVLRVPWNYNLDEADGDGVLVSNGPGDPAQAEATVANLRRALTGQRPVFGICLGNQLVGRALGLKTYKLAFGHRSQNQPCLEVGTQRCYITSQNHGYALDATSLPDEWTEWFRNANDGSNEGIRHESGRFQTVQFHPEAMPGPTDCAYLFDRFLEVLR